MRRNYRTIVERDGSKTVVTTGPMGRGFRLWRYGMTSFCLVAAVYAAASLQWSPAITLVLSGLLLLPVKKWGRHPWTGDSKPHGRWQ